MPIVSKEEKATVRLSLMKVLVLRSLPYLCTKKDVDLAMECDVARA